MSQKINLEFSGMLQGFGSILGWFEHCSGCIQQACRRDNFTLMSEEAFMRDFLRSQIACLLNEFSKVAKNIDKEKVNKSAILFLDFMHKRLVKLQDDNLSEITNLKMMLEVISEVEVNRVGKENASIWKSEEENENVE